MKLLMWPALSERLKTPDIRYTCKLSKGLQSPVWLVFINLFINVI